MMKKLLGALAVAPDYYFRKGEDLTKITDIPKLMPLVNSKPDAELFADLDATVAWAKSQGGNVNRLGIMGFCRGGRTVWEYATHNPKLKAGVAFYGSLSDPEAQKAIWPPGEASRVITSRTQISMVASSGFTTIVRSIQRHGALSRRQAQSSRRTG